MPTGFDCHKGLLISRLCTTAQKCFPGRKVVRTNNRPDFAPPAAASTTSHAKRDIFFAFPEGDTLQRKNIDAVIEIFAKAARSYLLFQIPTRFVAAMIRTSACRSLCSLHIRNTSPAGNCTDSLFVLRDYYARLYPCRSKTLKNAYERDYHTPEERRDHVHTQVINIVNKSETVGGVPYPGIDLTTSLRKDAKKLSTSCSNAFREPGFDPTHHSIRTRR